MTDQQMWAFDRLVSLGWLPAGTDPASPGFSFEAALLEYQQFHGLPVTGELDDATVESLQALRVCGFPDQMVMEVRLAPVPAIWRWVGSLPSVPDDQVRAAIQESFDRWARVAPLPAREAQQGEQPNTVITAVRIDGRNGVLADMYLPGPMPQNGRLDTSEVYTIAVPIPSGRIGLVNVVCHELGHRHGLGHLQTPGCLMNPIYSPALAGPQPGDVQAISQLYPGGPNLPPSPPVPPTPGPGGESVVRIEIYGARKIVLPGFKVTPA